MAQSVGLMLWTAAGAAAVLLIFAIMFRHPRRARTAGLILLILVPVLILARGAAWPVSRAYVFVVIPGSEQTLTRLIRKLHPATVVGQVRLAAPVTPESEAQIPWTAAGEVAVGRGGPFPVVAAKPNWLARVAEVSNPGNAWRVWHWLAQPTVVIPTDGDFWAGVDASTVDVSNDRTAFEATGQQLFAVDSSESALASGRLEVIVIGSPVPALGVSNTAKLGDLAASADVRLVGCRYEAVDNAYTLRAWIDRVHTTAGAEQTIQLPEALQKRRGTRSTGPPTSALLRIGPRPEDPRGTKLKLGEMYADATRQQLQPGFHRLDVDLSFEADDTAGRFRVTYAASVYFEVATRSLVVVSGGREFDAVRPTWAHRLQDGSAVAVPDVAELLRQTVEVPGMRIPSGNNMRLPFTRVATFRAADLNAPASYSRFRRALSEASLLLLSEPDWTTVERLDADVAGYVTNGGAVLTLVPPAPPNTAAHKPNWLPAVGVGVERAEGGVNEWAEPRVYFVPDHSRPATQFPPFNASRTAWSGARLQAEVINKLYDKLGVTNRYGQAVSTPIERAADGYLSATPAGGQVNFFTYNRRTGLVVPPVFLAVDDSAAAVRRIDRRNQGDRVNADAAVSWGVARLWSLTDVGRSRLGAALSPVSEGLSPASEVEREVFDAPLRLPHFHRRCVVVVFALDITQPPAEPPAAPWASLEGKAWVTRTSIGEVARDLGGMNPVDLTKAGVRVLVVPIRLGRNLAKPYSNPTWRSLEDWTRDIDAKLLPALDLSNTDASAANSVEAVVEEVSREVLAAVDEAPVLSLGEAGRAITHRVTATVDGPRVWRKVEARDRSSHPQPAAVVRWSASSPDPALMWSAVGEGTAYVLAYSPVAYDRWSADFGPGYPDPVAGSIAAEADGWGLQRLCDPVLLAACEPARGPTIDAVTPVGKDSSVLIDIALPAGRAQAELPRVYDSAGHEVGVVGLSRVDPRRRSLTLSVSADSSPLEGWHKLIWPTVGSADPQKSEFFLSVKPARGTLHGVIAGIDWVAALTGGAALPAAEFEPSKPALGASISLAWVGASLLPIGVILLLSPVARVWSPLPRRGRDTTRPPEDVDSDADLEAALDAIGMEMGSPTAQRPAGRVLQIRAMRPGDPPMAARKTDWGFFLDDVVAALGSPVMPKVLETPRLDSLSILTVLDLHAGATARDRGAYADRVRAMVRVATVNALVAARRNGSHAVVSLQRRAAREDETNGPDQVEAAVARLAGDRTVAGPVRLPDLVSGEAVVLVTDPGSDVDELLSTLVRRCSEERSPLAVVFLTHPEQAGERGLMRVPGLRVLVDRADTEPAAVTAFLNGRVERLKGLMAVGETRVASVRTDQPCWELVSILMDEVWGQI